MEAAGKVMVPVNPSENWRQIYLKYLPVRTDHEDKKVQVWLPESGTSFPSEW